MTTIRERVLAIIRDRLPCEPGDVTDSATFLSLGADSLDSVELTIAFEDEFHIELSDDAANNITTVGDCIAALERRLAEREAA